MPTNSIERFLGLSLGGAKSERTCVSVIDWYPEQEKAFVVDVYEAIGAETDLTGDQVLIELMHELSEQPARIKSIGVDVPVTLPPCFSSCEKSCSGYEFCKRPEVEWMRRQFRRAYAKNRKLKHPTPYSQRPVDVYFRYKFPNSSLGLEETFGANLAPRVVRLSYLRRFITTPQWAEVWPKTVLFLLARDLRLSKRDLLRYRQIEDGIELRQQIVERIIEQSKIFIYDRDLKKIVQGLSAFDSFICAWSAFGCRDRVGLLPDRGFPLHTGWISVPSL